MKELTEEEIAKFPPKPIYPMVRVDDNGYRVAFETYLRQKHTDGKWYVVHFFDMWRNVEKIEDYLNRFHHWVYMFQIKGIITPNAKITDGVGGSKLIHPLDENQEDESERLNKIMGI